MQQFSLTVPLSSDGVTMAHAFARQLESLLTSHAGATHLGSESGEAPTVKRGRKPAADKAATPVAAPAPVPVAEDDGMDFGLGDDELGLSEPVKKLSLEADVFPAIRAALTRVKGDKNKLQEVLDGFGVKKVQLVPEEKWPQLIAAVNKVK